MQADAELTFPEGGSPKDDVQSQYKKKPEIKVTTALAFLCHDNEVCIEQTVTEQQGCHSIGIFCIMIMQSALSKQLQNNKVATALAFFA